MSTPRDDTDFGELNLLPIMNMVCLLIPFLLMAAQFIQIGVIMVETPRLSHVKSQPDEQKKEALILTLVVTDKGFYLKSRHGSECPEGVSDDEKLCFRKKEGKFSEAMIKALHHHLWFLHASKYKSEERRVGICHEAVNFRRSFCKSSVVVFSASSKNGPWKGRPIS